MNLLERTAAGKAVLILATGWVLHSAEGGTTSDIETGKANPKGNRHPRLPRAIKLS